MGCASYGDGNDSFLSRARDKHVYAEFRIMPSGQLQDTERLIHHHEFARHNPDAYRSLAQRLESDGRTRVIENARNSAGQSELSFEISSVANSKTLLIRVVVPLDSTS